MTGPVDWDSLVLSPVMATFGEACTLSPATGGTPISFTGVYDEGFRRAVEVPGDFGLHQVHISSSAPILGCRAANFPTPPRQGDMVSVRGRSFAIAEVRPDSHGGLHLVLNEGNAPPEIQYENIPFAG